MMDKLKGWLQNPRNRLYLGILVALVWARFIIVPLLDMRKELVDNYEFIATQSRDLEQLQQGIVAYQHNLQVLEEQHQQLLSQFSQSQKLAEEQLEVLERLEKMAATHKVQPENRIWKTRRLDDQITESQLQIRMKGQGRSIQAFMLQLQDMSPALLVTRMAMVKTRNSVDKQYNLDLLLTYYHVKDGA